MNAHSHDTIVRSIDIAAPPERVWSSLTDHRAFGTWFRVALDQPFVPGRETTGAMTYPGHEGTPWRSVTEIMEAPRRFVFRWPHGVGKDTDGAAHDGEVWTTVEFRLEPIATGTRVTVTESGFSALPEAARVAAIRGNTEGWEIQTGNLRDHAEG